MDYPLWVYSLFSLTFPRRYLVHAELSMSEGEFELSFFHLSLPFESLVRLLKIIIFLDVRAYVVPGHREKSCRTRPGIWTRAYASKKNKKSTEDMCVNMKENMYFCEIQTVSSLPPSCVSPSNWRSGGRSAQWAAGWSYNHFQLGITLKSTQSTSHHNRYSLKSG